MKREDDDVPVGHHSEELEEQIVHKSIVFNHLGQIFSGRWPEKCFFNFPFLQSFLHLSDDELPK